MKNGRVMKASLVSLLCIMILVLGSCINSGFWPRAKYERAEHLSRPMESLKAVAVETCYGSITIIGQDTTDCNVAAEICAQAPTEREAREIAEKVKVEFERVGETLEIKTRRPHLKNNRSVSVDFQITVPKQTSVNCSSSYGPIKLTDIKGDVESKTSYGSVKCYNVEGTMSFKTSYGSITCRDVSSVRLTAKSGYGDIDVACSISCPAEIAADVVTSYGDIEFVTPPEFGGEVSLRTSFGTIRTERPIRVIGEISTKELKGTVGEGSGKLHLKTGYGSIRIR